MKIMKILKNTAFFTIGSIVIAGEATINATKKSVAFVKSGESQKFTKDTINSIKNSAVSKYESLRQPSESNCAACDILMPANVSEFSDICLICMITLASAEVGERESYDNEDLRTA